GGRGGRGGGGGWGGGDVAGGGDRGGAAANRGAVFGHEGADGVERMGGNAPAVAQPAREFAVVDRAPAEGRLGKPGLAAIVGNFLQQLLGVHRSSCPRRS